MATFAPTRPVPAGAFFADLPLLPILGYRGAVRPPLHWSAYGGWAWEPRPGMSGPFFIASVHACFGEYPEEFFRACLRPSLAV